MDRNIYSAPHRAAEESTTHTAISEGSYSWSYKGRKIKVRLVYKRGDYELRFAGAISMRVPDADRRDVNMLVHNCHKWRAVNWL